MRHIITINGIQYDYDHFKWKRQVGVIAQVAEVWIRIAAGTLPAINDVITIKKELLGTTLTKWEGRVSGVGYPSNDKTLVFIQAHEYLRKIGYLPTITAAFTSPTKSSTIFQTEIGPNQATTDLTIGTINTSDTAPEEQAFGKVLSPNASKLHRDQAFKILQMISNRDVYIERSGRANFLNGAGVDRSSTIELVDGINGDLVGDRGYIEDSSKIVKKVIVKGKGVGSIDWKYGEAVDAGYVSTDKVRQFEMAFISKNSVCATVAQNILAELNKVTKYAKFQLHPELITIDYDIFDTVKLKAVLANKNVDENLKIYSIETEVSGDNEIVTLELANFTRGVWAPLVLPGASSQGNADLVSFSANNTQTFDQVGNGGGASVISEELTEIGAATVTTTESTIKTFTALSATKLAGTFVQLFFRIFPRKYGNGDGILSLRIFDGSSIYYPANPNYLKIAYDPRKKIITYAPTSILIPIELSGKTLRLKAKVNSGEVEVTLRPYLETIGEHVH